MVPSTKETAVIRYVASAVVLAAVGLVAVNAGAAKIDIGSSLPVFKGLPGVDGKSHSASDFKKDVLVLAITCNHCPVAVAYEDRMIDFTKKFGSKVDVVAINVNNLPADKLDKMKERAQEKGFNFSYLYDESQQIARALSAKVTPEFYVFDKARKLVYWGPLDNSQNASKASKTYLADAVQAALNGEAPATAKVKAFGCSVKFD